MKKWIIRIVVVVVVVVVVGIAAGAMFINSIARKGVEAGSTYALGVPTSLGSAKVGLMSGEFSMSGLKVDNPKGDFTTPDFLTLGSGNVAVSLGSLQSDTVEVPTFRLSDITLNLERKGDKSNYKIILDNLKRFESGESKPAEPSSEPSKNFVIKELLIENVKVHVDLLPVGGQLSQVDVPIDKIELKDVGSGGKDVKISDLAGVILKTIMTVAVQKGGQLPGDIANELTNGLGQLQDLGDQGITVLLGDGGVVQTLGKTGEELGKKAGEVGKQAEEGVKKLGEGIGNILGGDKGKDDK